MIKLLNMTMKGMLQLLVLAVVVGATWWMYHSYDEIRENTAEEIENQQTLSQWEWVVEQMVHRIYYDSLQERLGEEFSFLDVISPSRTMTPQEFADWQNNLQWRRWELNDYLFGTEIQEYWDAHEIDSEIAQRLAGSEPHDWHYFLDLFSDLTAEEQEAFTEIYLESLFNEDLIHNFHWNHDIQNIHYFALDHETENYVSQGNGQLGALADSNYTATLLSQLQEEFNDIAVLTFNNDGDMETTLRLADSENTLDFQFNFGEEGWEPFIWQAPRNMTFVFAMPRTLDYWDSIRWNQQQQMQNMVGLQLLNQVIWAMGAVLVAAILIPVRLLKGTIFWKNLLRIPLELVALAILFYSVAMIEGFSSVVSEQLRLDATFTWQPIATEENLIIAVNIAGWFILFALAAYAVLYLKNIFVIGFKETMTKHTLMVGLPYGLYRFSGRFDLSRPVKLKIFILWIAKAFYFGFLFILMANRSEIAAFFGLALYLAVTCQTVLLRASKIQSQFLQMSQITNAMAEGESNVQIDEDLGIFEAMKQRLLEIRSGFDKALAQATVHEQEKLRAITHAAGDLQAPLTAIREQAGYLQNEELEQETRAEVLDVLQAETTKLLQLSEGLYEAGSAATGNLQADLADVDVKSLLEEALFEQEANLMKANLMIRSNFPMGAVLAKADATRLRRIFKQLVANLAAYALPHTRAYIDLIESEQNVTLTMRNVSAEELDAKQGTATIAFAKLRSLIELQNGSFEASIDGDLFKVTIVLMK